MFIEFKKTSLFDQMFYIIKPKYFPSNFKPTWGPTFFFVEHHVSRKKIIMRKHNRCTNGVTNFL
jgi:hypothetical protein